MPLENQCYLIHTLNLLCQMLHIKITTPLSELSSQELIYENVGIVRCCTRQTTQKTASFRPSRGRRSNEKKKKRIIEVVKNSANDCKNVYEIILEWDGNERAVDEAIRRSEIQNKWYYGWLAVIRVFSWSCQVFRIK